MPVPIPTPIYRFTHIDNLRIYLSHEGLYAPNFFPDDGIEYHTCHNLEIQGVRRERKIECGPGGVIHDYVAFYFGFLSPMMLQLKTGQVEGYCEGQQPLIYLVSKCQNIAHNGAQFVFFDGHGIAKFSHSYDDLDDLDKIDWDVVYMRYWHDTIQDMDRQRRKQAEFLVYRFCNWSFINEIGVIDNSVKTKVEEILHAFPQKLRRPVNIKRNWYF